MSDWLMVGVWRLILRLPPVIQKKQIGKLAKRLRSEVGALSAQHRAVHHFVVRELPRFGRPMPPEFIAESLDLPEATVTAILAELEAMKAFLFRDEHGAVVWAYPVTAEATPHRIRFKSGETLYAAGAPDAMVTPFVQGRLRGEPVSITVETRCEHCSEPMTLEVDSDMNVRAEQPGAEPMIFIADVSVLDVKAPSIVDDFGRKSVFLWSEDHAREYRKNTHRTRGVYSPVDRLVEPFRIVQSAVFGFDTPGNREGCDGKPCDEW